MTADRPDQRPGIMARRKAHAMKCTLMHSPGSAHYRWATSSLWPLGKWEKGKAAETSISLPLRWTRQGGQAKKGSRYTEIPPRTTQERESVVVKVGWRSSRPGLVKVPCHGCIFTVDHGAPLRLSRRHISLLRERRREQNAPIAASVLRGARPSKVYQRLRE